MKRVFFLSAICLLCIATISRGQNSSASSQEAEENYKALKGHVEDMLAAQADQQKRLLALAREIADLREQTSKPTGNYASQEDLKRLADAVQEIDKKREADKELILKEISRLGKVVTAAPPRASMKPVIPDADPAPRGDETGFYYVIQPGDTLGLIAKAYREKGIKITSSRIVEANPGLKAEKLIIGQKIFIPAPKAATAKN